MRSADRGCAAAAMPRTVGVDDTVDDVYVTACPVHIDAPANVHGSVAVTSDDAALEPEVRVTRDEHAATTGESCT